VRDLYKCCMTFSTAVREGRESKCLTQCETARLLGVSQQHLSLIERGGSRPSLPLYLRLVDVLGLDPRVGLASSDLRYD
jgi:transcriptional regulator with XRE-family HTH domain